MSNIYIYKVFNTSRYLPANIYKLKLRIIMLAEYIGNLRKIVYIV